MNKRLTSFIVLCLLAISLFGCATNTFIEDKTAAAKPETSVPVESDRRETMSSNSPSPTTVVHDITLKPGDEGSEVGKLQKRLAELGYFKAELTDYYGEKTEESIKAFQKENNLQETGIANTETQQILFSNEAIFCPLPLEGYIIGIDPGHQSKGNSEQEPISPGSNKTKKKVSSGTQGRFTGVPEYQVNLDVALLLRDLLVEQGATVVMTRETNDVNISNIERAQYFNEYETDYALRLHCNGSEDKTVHGAFMLVPTENPYLEDCDLAADLLINSYCEATGAKNLGITKRSDQTGFNWSERMVINIEMGHMTNREEDEKLSNPEYQKKMAQGLCNGILEYFEIKQR